MITHPICQPWEQEISNLKNKIQELMLEREQYKGLVKEMRDTIHFSYIGLPVSQTIDRENLGQCLSKNKELIERLIKE